MSKYIGVKFNTNNCGELTVIGVRRGLYEVQFKNTGFRKLANLGDIKSGMVKDPNVPTAFGVGFLGVGEHKTSINGRETPHYKAWKNMLARCYDDNTQSKNPTYIGCSVCNEWLSFQVFSDWYLRNKPSGNYHLDKDTKVIGNKLYSPETCLFITASENTKAAHGVHGRVVKVISPAGDEVDVLAIDAFCKKNGISHSSFRRAMKSGNCKNLKGWSFA